MRTQQHLPAQRSGPWAILLVLLALWVSASNGAALDMCLARPWQTGSNLAAGARVVSLSKLDDLQELIDAAEGPTTFVVQTPAPPLVAIQPLHINKSDITIAASLTWLRFPAGKTTTWAPPRLQVACSGTAGPLLQVDNAQNVALIGLHISGCTGSAIQLNTVKRAVLRGCTFLGNSNSTSGGAVEAVRSQLWIDSCSFQENTAATGSGGAVTASFSQLLVSGSSFANNSAGVSGGAVALRGRSADAAAAAAAGAAGPCWKDADVVLHDVSFSSNKAKLHGGGLAANGTHIVMTAAAATLNKGRYGGVAYLGQTAQLMVSGNSSMDNNTATSSGGAVYAVSPGARVTLSNSSFSNNQAKILGGVVSVKEAASLRLDSCNFLNNTADLAAGAIYVRDADLAANTSSFISNSAKRDGGALYCAGGCKWKLRACTFKDNECGTNGGAIFGWNIEASITYTTLDENTAGALGGAVAVANSTLELKGCKLGGNNGQGSDAAGGGLYSQGSTLSLSSCFLTGNVASWGGAVYITNSTLTMVGGAIANSSSTGSGAALYVLRSGVSITNASLSYNGAQQTGGTMFCSDSACSFAGCDILGDSATQGGGCIWVGRGSLSLRRSAITGCVSAADNGGAVHAAAATSVMVAGCSFKGCSALKGSGGAMWLSSVRSVGIRGSLFAQNQAMYGGSLFVANSTTSLSSSSVINSTATVGGGIAATLGSEITLFNGTAVAGNAAAVGGGIAADSTRITMTGPVTVSWNKALRPSSAATTPPAAAAAANTAAAASANPSAVFGGQAVLRGLGGGLYAHNSRVLAAELRLDRNTADRVGAGAYLDRCGVKVVSSNISRNSATEQAGGLKLLNPAQGSALLNCTVSNNFAGAKGGGMALVGVDLASEVALVDVDFVNNTAAGQAGGGLWLSGPLGLLMVGGEVSGNTAGTSDVAAASSPDGQFGSSDSALQAAGGGILLQDCSWAALHAVDVHSNAALAGCGGGLALSGCSKFLLSGSTVLGNVAGSGGGVCALDVSSFLTLQNSTVSRNMVLLGGLWGSSGAAAAAALSPTPEPHLSCGVQGTGGGMCISALGEVLINGSTLSRNQARNGGAIALGLCSDGDKCSLGLVGARFLNNTAVQGGGGAVYFSTAVSPHQVRCGEDFNVSSSGGGSVTAGSSSFPSLGSLLDSAAFAQSSTAFASTNSSSSTAADTGTSSGSTSSGAPTTSRSSTAGPSSSGSATTGINDGVDTVNPTPAPSSSSTEDDILASTPGSQGAGAGTGGAAAAGSPAAGDAIDTSSSSSGDPAATTTVTFDAVEGAQAAAAPAAASLPATTGGVVTAMPGAQQAESAQVGSGIPLAAAAAPSGSTPQPVASSSSATLSSAPSTAAAAAAASAAAEAEDIQASTPGFIPAGVASAAQPQAAQFTIASVPEVRPSIKVPPGSPLAAFQAKSAQAAAGLSSMPQQQQQQGQAVVGVAAAAAAGSARHKGHQQSAEAQLPVTQFADAASDATALAAVAGASAEDSKNGQVANKHKLTWELADASEGLRIIKGPQDSGSSTAATVSSTGSGSGVLGVQPDAQQQLAQGSVTGQQQPQQQQQLAQAPIAEASARTLAVPVTLTLLQAAEKAGVQPKVTTAWQRVGTVSLGTLVDADVVDPALLAEYWPAYRQSSSGTATAGVGAAQSSSNSSAAKSAPGWQQQFYSGLAAALSQAAALQANRLAAVGGSTVASTAAAPQDQSPYAACDPVQNPAACPVPQPTRGHTVLSPAAIAAAPASAAAVVRTPGTFKEVLAGSSSSSGSVGGARRLAQVEDMVAAAQNAALNVTFMSTDVTAVGTTAPAAAGSSSFILQGASQCGLFLHNAALGARAYGPVVTSRPAGLRVWGAAAGNGTNSVLVATGGQLQVQVSVVDVFGGLVTSGAADFIRIRATLTPPMGSAAATGAKGSMVDLATVAALYAAGAREVDDNGVELSGLQQLSTSNGSLILSGLQLSGLPGTNTTLFITASDPTLLPASLPITLTSCSAGYMQLPGQCQLCPAGTFSFTSDEPLCSLCPVGASCNGTVLVPDSGFWQSTPRSAQVHACLNPAACARDALRQQQLADWQATHFGRGAVVGKSKDLFDTESDQYMSDQCAAGYTGRMCGVCTQEPAAIADNRVSHGMVGGACVACGERRTVIATFVLVRLFDLLMWAGLTYLACKAADAWAQAISLNPGVAAATAGSLPPSSAAAASSSLRAASKGGSRGELVLVTSAAAAAAAAEVPASAVLHAHVGVFVDYLQILAVISASAASYAWPKVLKTFLAAFAFVPLGTSRWVSAECLLPYALSYRQSIVGLLLTAALPLLYLMSSAAVWILGLFRGHTNRTAIMALVVGTTLFYPLITMSALSVFSCHTLDDSKSAVPGEQLTAVGSFWTLDPELQCYRGQHLQLTLGFGLPVVLLVVFAWPLLLASMLWDSRFRIRDQQLHPATRRRYLVRKTIKMCHQILGVMCGFTRPRLYLWPVVAEVRKLLLCVVVVLVAGSPPPVQLYVLWGLVAGMLVLEWWVKPGATWPITGLQLVALGSVQGAVYLASAFTQVSLVGSATTFAALIMVVCCMVAVAFLLSLIAANTTRASAWMLKNLDADQDGKVSRQDLYLSASKLLLGTASKVDPGSPGGKGGADAMAAGSSTSSRSSVWRGALVFFSKRRLAGAQGGAAADAAGGDDSSAQDQATSSSAAAGPDSPAGGRLTPGCRSPNLVASNLPITHAALASAAAASAGAGADSGVPTSSSIDMGMLAMLRQAAASPGSLQEAAAALAAAHSSQADASSRLARQPYVAVDLGQLAGGEATVTDLQQHQQQLQQQQQQRGRHHAVNMGRANSLGAPGPNGTKMRLHAYMSVQQWLEQSEELSHNGLQPGGAVAGPGAQTGLPPSGLAAGGRASSMGRSRSLQLSASTPAPQLAALRSSSGSLALHRAQLLLQSQQQQHMVSGDHGDQGCEDSFPDGVVDLSTLRSVSEAEQQHHLQQPQQQQQQRQQRRRGTGSAAAARAREIAAAAAAAAAAGGPAEHEGDAAGAPAVRHQPYYALWSNIASAITGPSGSVSSAAAGSARAQHSTNSSRHSERQQSGAGSSRHRGVAAGSSSITRSSAGTRGMHSSTLITGSITISNNSTRVRQSPFAAAAAAAAAAGSGPSRASGVRPSPFAATASPAAAGSGSGMAASGRAVSAPNPHAAAAAMAAAAAGAAPSVSKGRHSSYYSMWQAAIAEASGDAAAAAADTGAIAAQAAEDSAHHEPRPGMHAESAATAPPIVLEPRHHKSYINAWAALAEELGDGPSAVGAAAPGPVVPGEVAAAFAAAMAPAAAAGSAALQSGHGSINSTAHSPQQHPPQKQEQPGGVPASPFASIGAVAAALQEEEAEAGAAAADAGQQEEPQRRRRRSGRRPRDSAGTCLGSDSD